MTDLNAIRDFALELAREAGETIVRARAQGVRTEYKAHLELVTDADVAVDNLIHGRIREAWPEHAILSEEAAPEQQVDVMRQGPLWVVDPIDGTVNFAHNQPQVAVSIAFMLDGEAQVGVVHAPFQNETFVAVKGQGATLNGQPIQVSGETDFRQALIATGFPYDKAPVPGLIKRLARVLGECRDVRRIGSAALDICWVAMGRLDAYYESVSPWDFAAARLIASEAGARCGHVYGVEGGVPEALYGRDIIISSPALYDHLRALVEEADLTALHID
ncbi:MAG: inositol monophosphatase [Gammaproteobacteria bacterium]|nr:MAG: inositol monophosphatase [Gammaproteobacteria bacterium]